MNPTPKTPVAPSPILQDLNNLGVPRLSADGLSLVRPDGTAFCTVVATPVADPPGDIYGPSQLVALTSDTADAIIYFTTDDSKPTRLSDVYADPIAVETDTVVRAFAVLEGQLDSQESEDVYVITNGTLPTPVINPNGGAITDADPIELTCAQAGAAIYYTTDGSTPTQLSTLYADPFTLDASATVKAKAFLLDWADSATASADFVVGP